MTKPREPAHTVAFVDDYCVHYRTVFPNARQLEQFTCLELCVRLTILAHRHQVVVDDIHRALATVALAATRALGLVVDEPGVLVRLAAFRRRVEALA